jgi:hypothetical protein
MSKRHNSTDRTGRSKKSARHVRLHHWMMQTEAWKSLSGNQRAILVEMAARYNGSNNGRIHFSIREAAAAVHVSKATAARDLAVLQDRGFIVARIRGGFNVKDKRAQATEWRLTEFNCDVTGALPSKEFARWSPEFISRSHYEDTNVPLARPERPSVKTETKKKGRERPSSETFKPVLDVPRSHQRDTYSLPGGGSSVSASPAAPDLTTDLSIPDFLRRDLTPIDQSRAKNRARRFPASKGGRHDDTRRIATRGRKTREAV